MLDFQASICQCKKVKKFQNFRTENYSKNEKLPSKRFPAAPSNSDQKSMTTFLFDDSIDSEMLNFQLLDSPWNFKALIIGFILKSLSFNYWIHLKLSVIGLIPNFFRFNYSIVPDFCSFQLYDCSWNWKNYSCFLK